MVVRLFLNGMFWKEENLEVLGDSYELLICTMQEVV
jgi:hypothetical protein